MIFTGKLQKLKSGRVSLKSYKTRLCQLSNLHLNGFEHDAVFTSILLKLFYIYKVKLTNPLMGSECSD